MDHNGAAQAAILHIHTPSNPNKSERNAFATVYCVQNHYKARVRVIMQDVGERRYDMDTMIMQAV